MLNVNEHGLKFYVIYMNKPDLIAFHQLDFLEALDKFDLVVCGCKGRPQEQTGTSCMLFVIK